MKIAVFVLLSQVSTLALGQSSSPTFDSINNCLTKDLDSGFQAKSVVFPTGKTSGHIDNYTVNKVFKVQNAGPSVFIHVISDGGIMQTYKIKAADATSGKPILLPNEKMTSGKNERDLMINLVGEPPQIKIVTDDSVMRNDPNVKAEEVPHSKMAMDQIASAMASKKNLANCQKVPAFQAAVAAAYNRRITPTGSAAQ